ncbi:MAG: hypothetical protein LBF55_01450 [Prevotellaceae bacterium]|jgi:hypothetical protein|nr:hypothetical protein [Prevotellaceae bacterium]
MKRIYLLTLAAAALCAFAGCKKELPYPIDEVKRGVLIDIVRAPGSDGVLAAGETTGSYKVKLTIPEYQGDYSSLSHAQLLAVLTNAQGTTTSRVAVDNITGFPKEVDVNIADVYGKFGLTAPALGEVLYFTTNVVLKNGDLIPGWSEYMGFNNRAFSGWKVDDRAYSYNVRYPVACPLDVDDFVGEKTIDDEWWEDSYPVTVSKRSETELAVSGLFEGDADNDLIITIDPTTHTVSIAKQVLVVADKWWGAGYTNFSLAGSGTIDACDGKITFSATATVDQGSFGAVAFTIY